MGTEQWLNDDLGGGGSFRRIASLLQFHPSQIHMILPCTEMPCSAFAGYTGFPHYSCSKHLIYTAHGNIFLIIMSVSIYL
jgi:hypothetical protein